MNKLLTHGLVALALGALALAACGGDDDDSKAPKKDEATQSATANSGDDKSSSGITAAATAEPTKKDGDGQVTGSGADALKKLAKDLSTKTYQVTYDYEEVDAAKKATKSTLTIAQKPPKSVTSFSELGGSGVAIAIISDGTTRYTCAKQPNTPGQCQKSKVDATKPVGNFLSLDSLLKSLSEDFNVTSAGSRSIAGLDSQCFNATGKAVGDEGIACFSKKDGIVTLVDSKDKDGSTTHIEATKASNSADESLFTVPTGYTITGQ
ncbi:MAG: hypothetical protein ABIP13_03610 [Tepidiformaceae bacterium]